MSGTKRSWAGFSNAEIEEKLKRESPEYKAQQEREGREIETSRWERYKAKVRREEAERAQQRQLEDEAIRAMTPAEYDAFKKRVPDPGLTPLFPPRYMMALEDNRRDDAKARIAERERRERDLGLPKLQAAHAAKVEQIRAERLEAEAAAEEAKRNARDYEREQLASLGECPTLESLEVAAA